MAVGEFRWPALAVATGRLPPPSSIASEAFAHSLFSSERLQEDQDRLPLASSSSAVVLIRSLRRLHCDGLQPSCTKCLKSRDKAECIYMPVSL